MPIDLFTACYRGDLKAVRAALNRGEDVNSKDDLLDKTPLTFAARYNGNSTVKFLLEHGFDFNLQYSKGAPYFRGNDNVSIWV